MSVSQSIPTIPDRWRRCRLDLLLLSCLGLAAWRLSWSMESFVDIGLHDETGYLWNGVFLWENGLPGAQWGPLYCVWYWVLHLFESDPVRLYYLNYRALAVLIPLLIYLTARRFCVTRSLALLPAFIYLVSPAPHVWPRVSHFALLVILACLVASAGCRRPLLAQTLLALGFLAASFCRPELFVSFAAAAGWVMIQLFRGLRIPSPDARVQAWIAGSWLAGGMVLLLWVGSPLGGGTDSNRSLLAFAQHYTLNLYRRTNNPENPWTTADAVLQSRFGSAQSLTQVIARNPREFFRHAGDNLRQLPGKGARLFLVSWSDLIGARANAFLRWLEFIGLLAAVAWAGGVALARKPAAWRQFLAQSGRTPLALATVLSLLATLPSAVIIYPRDHYLLVSGVLALCLGATALAAVWPKEHTLVAVALAAAVVLITPDCHRGWRTVLLGQVAGINQAAKPGLPNLKIIKFIQALPFKGPVTLLENEGGYHAYLGPACSWVPAYEKQQGESFLDFARRRSVNMIVLTQSLAGDARFRNDAAFRQFIGQPEAHGFTALPVPGLNASVLVSHHLRDQ